MKESLTKYLLAIRSSGIGTKNFKRFYVGVLIADKMKSLNPYIAQ